MENLPSSSFSSISIKESLSPDERTIVGMLSTCILCSCFIIPCLVFGITQIIIATITIHDNSCHNDLLLLPTTWLLVEGISEVVFVFVFVISFVLIAIINELIVPLSVCCALPFALFSFTWSIIGGIVLFRDNLSCGPNSLQIILWIVVIFKIYIWFAICCLRKSND